jgi:hypothetical protein
MRGNGCIVGQFPAKLKEKQPDGCLATTAGDRTTAAKPGVPRDFRANPLTEEGW